MELVGGAMASGAPPAAAPSDGSTVDAPLSRGLAGLERVQQPLTPCSPSASLQAAGTAATAAPLKARPRASSSPAGSGLIVAKPPSALNVARSSEIRAPASRRDAERAPTQVGDFPALPPPGTGSGFRFDPAACSRLLEVAAPNCLRCTANATRTSQGVGFLEPPVRRGERAKLSIRFDNKPGRMRYFLGVARRHFGVDAPDVDLRGAGWSIENLYAGPHAEGAPCRMNAIPLFHTGSVVTLVADLTEPSKAYVSFEIDTTGVTHRVALPGRALESVVFWVSLYNRFAQITILDA
mmetsp:Transcript_24005/g.66765  ORF Transcript_24005/g.66765 Transcript_24005/m.66765 type:complete len:295 (+) Transcript_24005:495-1379(+)